MYRPVRPSTPLGGTWGLAVARRSVVPADRWDFDAFYDENPRATDKSYAPAGGFIDDVRSFPALALQIPPRRVEVMDPQQRLGLEICLAAVEDAGYNAQTMPTQTGAEYSPAAWRMTSIWSGRVISGFSTRMGNDEWANISNNWSPCW